MAEKKESQQVPADGRADATHLAPQSGQDSLERDGTGRSDARKATFGAKTMGADQDQSDAGSMSDSSQGEFSGQVRSAPAPGHGIYDSPHRTSSISPEGERRTAASPGGFSAPSGNDDK